jgi:spermidine synthase
VVADPLVWLGAHPGARFDVVIADFPWPLGYREGKLYTHHVFALLAAQLAEGGLLVVPGGSGFAAPEALDNVTATLASAGLRTAAYHVAVPTLGVASFVVASWRPVDPAGLRVAFPGLDAGLDLVTTGRGQAATLHAQTVLQAFDDARARR